MNAGLSAYGRGDVSEAAESWRAVLRHDPGNAQARDYLQSAGLEVESDATSQLSKVVHLDAHREDRAKRPLSEQVKTLLAEKKYTEVLDLLAKERQRAPGPSETLTRAMRYVKDKIVVSCIEELGPLDQLVHVAVSKDVLDALHLDQETQTLLKYIDGETSIADVVRFSLLEKHIAMMKLVSLDQRGLIALTSASFSLPPTTAGGDVGQLYQPPPPAELRRAISSSRIPQPAPPEAKAQGDTADAPPSPSDDDAYEECFQQATLAYLKGDLEGALAAFRQCEKARPDDARVQHNIARLTGDAS